MSEVVALSDCRSQGCRDWVRAGRPYKEALPVSQFQDTVAAHGLTVYTYPNKAHLTTVRPEDHTPFSATGWPVPAPRWYGNAADVMPRGGSWETGGPELVRLARQIISDKDAGVPGTEWIKYMNWTDEHGNCWQTSWKNGKVTVSSTDEGHLHLSGRSDMVTAVLPVYDPVARMNGEAGEDDDMGASFGPISIEREGITSLTIPPVLAGAADPRPAWLNLCNASGDQQYRLRIWYSKGTADAWKPLMGDGWVNGERTMRGGERVSVPLEPGTAGLDIRRLPVNGKVYAGHLTVAIERGPVMH